jgi:autotransporter family porin
LSTTNDNHYLYLNSSGKLTATNAGAAFGIYTGTDGNNSPIGIINAGDIVATSTANSAYGIVANALSSTISIENSGDLTVTATRLGMRALGIYAYANGPDSPISIVNNGNFLIQAGGYAFGVAGRATAPNDPISIVNSGDMIVVSANSGAFGLYARANYQTSPVSILNSGTLSVTAHFVAHGIFGETRGTNSPVSIENHGDIFASGTSADSRSAAIGADSFGSNSPLSIVNAAKLTGANQAFGI